MSFNERLKLTVVFEDEAVGYCTDYYPDEYPSDGNVQFVTVQEAERAIAEAVAAERERCLRIVMREGITPAIPDDPDPVAEAINGALQNIHEAIRSAAK